VHYIRFILIGDEIASPVFGKAGVNGSQELRVIAVGVEQLQLRTPGGALRRGGGDN